MTPLDHLTDAERSELLRNIARTLGFNPDHEVVTTEALMAAVERDYDYACRYRGLL